LSSSYLSLNSSFFNMIFPKMIELLFAAVRDWNGASVAGQENIIESN